MTGKRPAKTNDVHYYCLQINCNVISKGPINARSVMNSLRTGFCVTFWFLGFVVGLRSFVVLLGFVLQRIHIEGQRLFLASVFSMKSNRNIQGFLLPQSNSSKQQHRKLRWYPAFHIYLSVQDKDQMGSTLSPSHINQIYFYRFVPVQKSIYSPLNRFMVEIFTKCYSVILHASGENKIL